MAGHLILVTVGTSALDHRKLEPLRLWESYQNIRIELNSLTPQRFGSWVQGEGIPRKVAQFIDAYADALRRLDIDEEVRKPPKEANIFSGEMSSLFLMYKNSDKDVDLNSLDPQADTVVLLLSASPEGILCGLLHRRWLSEGKFLRSENIIPELKIIDGLQVENLPQFLQTGLGQFSNTLREYTKGRTRKSLLCTTGGFKSLIPYSTFFCLAYQTPMFFVFEELPYLIAIKPSAIETKADRERLLGFVQQVFEQSPGHFEVHLSDL